MALNRVGNNLASRNHLPVQYVKAAIARFYAQDLIPNITSSEYVGDLLSKGKGDTAYIRRAPVIVTEDSDVNADINWQEMDLERISVNLSYLKRSAIGIAQEDLELSDMDLMNLIQEYMSKAHSEAINSTVLGSVYTGATTTAYATGTTPWAWNTPGNSPKALAQAFAQLSALKVPDDGNRFAVIHPLMAQYITQEQAGWALNSGASTGAQIDGHIGKYAGLDIYVSPLVAGAGTASNPFKTIVGHKSAIAMAGLIKNAWTGPLMPIRPGQGVYQESIFGFTVAQPDALVYSPATVS